MHNPAGETPAPQKPVPVFGPAINETNIERQMAIGKSHHDPAVAR